MIDENGCVQTDHLITFGHAPGYGDMTITVALNGIEAEQIDLVFSREDIARLKSYIETVQQYDRKLDQDPQS